MSEQPKMTYEQWKQQGKELFGEDMLQWQFECPSCGNVQTPQDFADLSKEINPNVAYMNCIGRYVEGPVADIFSDESPCNYTSGGLFNLNPLVVKIKDKDVRAFDFHKPEGGRADR